MSRTLTPFAHADLSRRAEGTRVGLALVCALGLHGAAVALAPGTPTGAPRGAELFPLHLEAAPAPEPESPPEPPAPPPEEATPRPRFRAPVERLVPIDLEPKPASAEESTDSQPGGPEPGPPVPDGAPPLVTAEGNAASWAMTSGSGSTPGSSSRAAGSGSGGPGGSARSSSSSDLSRAPIPPDLRPLLVRNYPPAARMSRTEGTATVEARVSAEGVPSDLRVRSVDPRGVSFGETCTRSVLQGPRWQPALDRAGKPIAATVRYVCRFVLPAELRREPATDTPASSVGANRVWTRPAR